MCSVKLDLETGTGSGPVIDHTFHVVTILVIFKNCVKQWGEGLRFCFLVLLFS